MKLRRCLGFLMLLAGCLNDRPGGLVDALPPDAASDAPPASAVTFRLSYRTDVIPPDSIYVQANNEAGFVGWIAVLDASGRVLAIQHDCGVCLCDRCSSCAVCGIAQPQVAQVVGGSSIDWTWDATTFLAAQCPNGFSCETTRRLAPGHYTARFCYSFSTDGVGGGHHVGPLSCDDVPFDYPVPGGMVERLVCACG